MQHLWIFYVFIYSFLKGTRDGMKKAALKRASSSEILFFYSLIGLILILPFSKNAFHTPPIYIFYTFIKSAVVSTGWLMALYALNRMTVSLYGIMDMSRMIFSTFLGVVVLGETLTIPKVIGIVLVILGLTLVNTRNKEGAEKANGFVLTAALLNCVLNSISGTMDKALMKTMEADQLQFWFMLFSFLFYSVIIMVRKEKISLKSLKGNYWVPLMSASLVFGDRLLFIANAMPESQVTLMTVIKQSAVIVTIICGRLFFKDKDIAYKLMCASVILCGIFIALLWG